MNQQSNPPPDRYCDLVMKGGITSGIVYPLAILELAKHYRFKNIGGTSAGAIAAAVTAAAEYQRRKTDSMAGFERLAQLPQELGAPVSAGQSRLLSLFQPNTSCRRLFKVLVYSLNRTTTFGRTAAIVWGFVRAYWPSALVSALAAALIWWFATFFTALLFLIIAVVASIGYWVYWDVTRNAVKNNYGLCNGMTEDKNGPEALTPWLHALIQEAAGRPADKPLTFGDLWDAPGFPPQWLTLPPRAQVRSIDLQMFTTNLSHGRPYVLPHTEPEARLFYKSDELLSYLPKEVMTWIDGHARPYTQSQRNPASDPDPAVAKKEGLKELPPAKDFPVLLAARMSLSFPLLFSAVPLWAIDYDSKQGSRGFQRCMFSDGGISSNFPMHLFDGLLPMWPTFGIQLEPKLPGRSNMIYLPQRYEEGYGERWNRFASEAATTSSLGGFLTSIVSAMQNWNDNTLSRMPGVRDRVVRLRLNEDEGGMNLNMEKNRIIRVATRGGDAARELVKRFVPKESNTSATGWDEQRWVRLDVLLRMLEKRVPGVTEAFRQDSPHATSYQALIDQGRQASRPGHQAPLIETEVNALFVIIQALEALSATFRKQSEAYSFEPIPEPELRVRPPL